MDDLDVTIVAKGLGALVVIACIAVFGGIAVMASVAAIVALAVIYPPPARPHDDPY